MAHFAKLDNNNVVIDIMVIHNNELLDETGQESEEQGIKFLTQLTGGHTNWKQTSYNGSFRKNYAGIGYLYDEDLDAFLPPKPYESWVINVETAQWESPIPYPDDEITRNESPQYFYVWDEEENNWSLRDKTEF